MANIAVICEGVSEFNILNHPKIRKQSQWQSQLQ